MIDKNLEPLYDILFSIFIGIVLVLALYNLYDNPRTITITDSNPEHFKNIKKPCNINT
jgi:hypothetical protein